MPHVVDINTSTAPNIATLAPTEIAERDLRSLVSGIYATLEPGERTYLRLRVDLMHSRKEAKGLTQLSAPAVRALEERAVPYSLELKMRRPNIERDEVVDVVRDAILMAKEANNPVAVLRGAQILSELGGISRPAEELESLRRGTASEISADVLEKLRAGEIDTATAQRLLQGLNQAATTQLQEEERARMQTGDSNNPFPVGSQMHLNAETKRRQMENLDYLIQMQANKTLGVTHDE